MATIFRRLFKLSGSLICWNWATGGAHLKVKQSYSSLCALLMCNRLVGYNYVARKSCFHHLATCWSWGPLFFVLILIRCSRHRGLESVFVWEKSYRLSVWFANLEKYEVDLKCVKFGKLITKAPKFVYIIIKK